MELERVWGENFLTLGKFNVNLANRGLLLIQGMNEDDPSAGSNGAGKSSLPDAICWCNFGETAREVSGDDVVNETAGKGCEVHCQWRDGDKYFIVSRYRKHATKKNRLMVGQITEEGSIDLTKGTDKDTQAFVEQIMGCSLEVFRSSIYAGQEKMPNLPGLTDKHLKLIVEEAAGTAIMDRAYQFARKDLDAAKAALASAAALHSTTNATIESVNEARENSLILRDQFELERKQECADLIKKATEAMTAYKDLKAELDASNEAELIAERDALRIQVDSRDELVKQHKALEQVAYNAKRSIDTLTLNLRNDKNRLDGLRWGLENLKAGILTIEGRVGTPCGECGRDYAHEHIDGAIQAQNKRIAECEQAIVEHNQVLADYVPRARAFQQAHTDAVEAATAFALTLPDITVVAKRIDAIAGELRVIDDVRARMNQNAKTMRDAKEAHDKRLKATNPGLAMIENSDRRLVELAREMVDGQRLVEERTRAASVAESVVKVFSPAGVRAHILDNVTPFLNERTAEYLSVMSDGNIHATWTTLTKTAKGELREKFGIEVTNDKGGKNFKAISGGEKRKARVATFMALQDLVATRASKPINLFVADEIDDALAVPGLERLMMVLEKKARDRGTVLIISHNSLADWCDNIITVTKRDGKSTVTGAV